MNITDDIGDDDGGFYTVQLNYTSTEKAFFYTSFSLLGIIGNCLVIFAIFTDSKVKVGNHLSNLGVLNLAFTDLMTTTIVCIPGAVVAILGHYPFGMTFCKVWAVFNLSGIVETMALLAFISLDRWIYVKWALRYHSLVTHRRYLCCVMATWIISFGVATSWTAFQVEFDPVTGVCDYAFAKFGPSNPAAFYYGIVGSTLHFILPTLVILVCNVGIVRISNTLWGKTTEFRRISTNSSSIKPASNSNSERKIIKSMFVVTLTYFILTVPVALIRVVRCMSGPSGVARLIPHWASFVAILLQFLASVINPFIYALFRKDFRQAYRKIWKRFRYGYLSM